MAAQFYARYVPAAKTPLLTSGEGSVYVEYSSPGPKKRKRDPDHKDAVSGTGICNPRLPIHAASQTDSKGGGNTETASDVVPTARVTSRNAAQSVTQTESVDAREVITTFRNGGSKVRSKKKTKDKEAIGYPVQDDNEEQTAVNSFRASITTDSDPKHKKIRSKFEHSSKLAEKLLKKKKTLQNERDDDPESEVPSIETHGLVPLPQPPEVADDPNNAKISVLPDWLATPLRVSPKDTLSFRNLSLSASAIATLAAKGYDQAFAIQTGVLPLLLPGSQRHNGDLCVSAATGSGKTLAYVLPMVESLRGKSVTKLRGLIVVPTRELVTQVRDTLQTCIAGTAIKVGTAVGSKSMKEEQSLLISKGQKYDPEGYWALQRMKLNVEDDLMNWDDDSDNSADEADILLDYTLDYTSSVDVLVCTPGRLVDHVKSTTGFTLDNVQWLIIDEADRLLDESFQQWIDIVLPALHAIPKHDDWIDAVHNLFHVHETREIQKIVLSATINKDISKLMALRLRRPRLVVLDSNVTTAVSGINNAELQESTTMNQQADVDLPSTLTEKAIPLKNAEEKPLYLLELLFGKDDTLSTSTRNVVVKNKDQKSEFESDVSASSSNVPSSDTSSSDSDSDSVVSSSSSDMDDHSEPSTFVASKSSHGTLVFTNNNENALRLARLLALLRPAWAQNIGTLTKSTATSTGRKTLAAFRKRKLSILIASDRASRGLDIEDLAQVINYDMPTSLTSYVHRVGRTARAGKGGVAITLVAHHEARWFWNDVARSKNVRRVGKVAKIENGPDKISEEDRKAYVSALRTLGQEARGEKVKLG